MSLSVRYPGRACLLGEHCDWAGGASLAVPLPLWIEVTVEPAERDLAVKSEMDGELLEGRWPLGGRIDPNGGPLRFVPAAASLLAERGIAVPPAVLWVQATLPTGRGFSSSAAFSLAVLDGLARHAGHAFDAEELAELAYVLEHDRLGVACGRLDQLSCVAGTAVFLRWRDGRARLRRVVPRGTFHLVVGAFSAPRDTRAILATLNRLHAASPFDPDPTGAAQGVHEAVATWGAAAEQGARALESGDLRGLGAAMDRAQRAYEEHLAARLPELAAPRLVEAVRALRGLGALGAKFSGAGGDGSVVALMPDRVPAERAAEHLRERGLAAWAVPLEAP